MPYADLSTGVRLYYEDLNPDADETVLAIHGWLGTARTDLPNVVDWLAAQGYRVIAPDMRGWGHSRPPQRDFPNDFYARDADDALALLNALGLSQVHLFGYSDGGEAALIAAGRAPGRFHTVATVGSVGYFGPTMRKVVQRNAPATFLINEPHTMALHDIADARGFVGGWIRAIVHMIDRGGDISVSLAPHMTMPVLLMLGDKDTLNPPSFARVLLGKLPDGRLQMFDAGHPVFDQQPERFRQVYSAFLRGQSA